MTDRVVVVGGGPAGLMAAGRAAEEGAEVLLVEKTARLGNKLRLTGGGRANISHAGDAQATSAHLGSAGPFLSPGLTRFGPRELMAFFNERAMPTAIELDGRVFPKARNAHMVVAALRSWCLAQHVTFRYRSAVNGICVDDGRVTGVAIDALTIGGGAVVLATGGVSYPNTGSTGDGYRLAEGLGHSVVPPAPGLIPLVCSDTWVAGLAGVSLQDVMLEARQGSASLASERGDVLFTSYGLSGPATLNLSSRIGRLFERGAVAIRIDLAPDTDAGALDAALAQRFRMAGRASLGGVMRDMAPGSLTKVIIQLSGADAARPGAEISAIQRGRMAQLLKGLELHAVATRPIQEAMVTLGGVSTCEIDPETMASRLVRGLFFAGELIDIAGDSGGYNLQAAFTSGWLAGMGAARAVREPV
ncbi:MAG: aminoacetone oxidase family FAD-binding enzyme [Chloroflexi bacterium]|nr:aminoacetone oxidase family FAD-binding enzyme [Chloroflexota bacterium]